jgi:hypothetical protein
VQIEAVGEARQPWDSPYLTAATEQLHAAELVLSLPSTDPHHSLAPAVAIEAIIAAARLFGAAAGETLADDGRALRRAGRKGMAARLATDPKQAAKREILAWWNGGRALGPTIRTGAAFDRAAVKRFPVIVDTKTVLRWRKAARKV